MFKKPIKIKTNNQLKGSERREIKDLFLKAFPTVSEADLNAFFNNKKDSINCLKVATHNNEIVQVYTVQKQPMFFRIEERMFPTVFLLWKFPSLIPHFTTHPQVMNFISSGADLMAPGVVTFPAHSGLRKYGNISKGAPVYVNLSNNKAAIAVGLASQDSLELERCGGKGKCVEVYHFYGDHLCTVEGSPAAPVPNLGAPEWLTLDNYSTDFPALGSDSGATESENNDAPEEQVQTDNSGDMDELLHYCFLASIKYSKTLTLPVLISNFFKLQMIPMCPAGAVLDIKKTSYKKLKPFLDDMAKIELITVKEIKKGVEAITQINKNHPKFNEFYLNPDDRPKKSGSDAEDPKTIVTESFIVTPKVLPLFHSAGYQKGDVIDRSNIRKCVTEHIKVNNCQVEDDSRLVKPSTEVLSLICKTENPVSWEEVFEKVCESMKSCFKVSSGKEQVFNKGKLCPIIMSVHVRSGNKKVTIVDNLEIFGVNINEFAKECQHGAAASTSITPTPPGKKCNQLLVQGNQVVYIHNLLVEKYKIPKNYIRGLDLAPKKKK